MPSEIRTRFAPSPTGYLHVGGARTALFNWLFARKHGGSFVLRVEDTDKERNTEEAVQAIYSGMSWLGMDWDEGPEKGGDCGPYFQSQRHEIYEKWFEVLKKADRVYQDGDAWRFRFERKPFTMNDLVCGEVTIDYQDESNTPDMVVRRSDGSFVFHFVNVVDDLEMKISHVIRGEDHLMNTPKHIQLFEAFGVKPPIYAHIPLILNMDGSKMSKRDTGAAVANYPKEGFTGPAIVNFLSLLGWSPKDGDELFSISELIERFSLDGVTRAPAKFDIEKCTWMNQQHLAKLNAEEFAKIASSYVSDEISNDSHWPKISAAIQEKVQKLTEISDKVSFFFDKDYPFSPEALEKVNKNSAAKDLLEKLSIALTEINDWNADSAKNAIKQTAKANGAKPGQLMFPSRVALSGQAGGPDLGEIFEILGKEESIRRINRCVNQL